MLVRFFINYHSNVSNALIDLTSIFVTISRHLSEVLQLLHVSIHSIQLV